MNGYKLGPVVQRQISAANPAFSSRPGLFFFCSKIFSRIIFSIIFRASSLQIVDKKIKLNLLFKLHNYLNSNFTHL